MTVLPLYAERRRRRSNKPLQALTYQLEHIFERNELHNFTLGDCRGLMIAQAGDIHESEILAAYAPMLARTVDRRYRRQVLSHINSVIPTITVDSIYVRRFRLDHQAFYLTLVGRPDVYRHLSLYRAISGVRRILAGTEAA